jgi:hypothetical protein
VPGYGQVKPVNPLHHETETLKARQNGQFETEGESEWVQTLQITD